MVGWHHRLNGHELEQALGVGDGQESLVCCSLWGLQESDPAEQLNRTELNNVKLIEPNGRFVVSATVSFEPPGGAISRRIWDLPEHLPCVYCWSLEGAFMLHS